MLILLYSFPTAAVAIYQEHWLETAQVSYLTVLEVGNPNIGLSGYKPGVGRAGSSWRLPGRVWSHLFWLREATAFLVHDPAPSQCLVLLSHLIL